MEKIKDYKAKGEMDIKKEIKRILKNDKYADYVYANGVFNTAMRAVGFNYDEISHAFYSIFDVGFKLGVILTKEGKIEEIKEAKQETKKVPFIG